MKIVITAGGTEEPIDKVRKITNMSTGTLGKNICENIILNWFASDEEDNHIYYICNENSVLPIQSDFLTIIKTTDTESVQNTIENILMLNKIDYFIHSMAISDYKVEGAYVDSLDETLSKLDTRNKMSSKHEEIYIKLVKTPKIVDFIKKVQPNINLISFKLLDNVTEEELINVAKKQLKRTNSCLVIANDLKNIDKNNINHKALMITDKDEFDRVETKKDIAEYIFNFMS